MPLFPPAALNFLKPNPRPRRSFQPRLEAVERRCVAATGAGTGLGAVAGLHVAQNLVHASQLTTFAVITIRNDSGGPINFELRVLPHFPRFEVFHLAPGHQRAFYSHFRPGIDSPQFQVEFLAIPERPISKVSRTLTVFNVHQKPAHFVPNPADGRLYTFRRTGIETRDLFLG